MTSVLAWFRRRPLTTLLLVVVYYVVVVTTHDHVQALAYWLQRTFGAALWGPLVAALALLGAGVLAWRSVRRLRGGGRPRGVAVAWWGTLAASVAASLLLLATNMEVVHFVQYALLAVPVLALNGRLGATVLIVTALGGFDELYQWVVLHPGWAVRYDANDVVLNALGGALGCATALVFGNVERVERTDARASAVTWGPLLVVALVLGAGGPVLAARHRLAVHREEWCPHTWLTLSRIERPQTRWQQPDGARAHHVLHPGTMLALCVVLAAGFCVLDDRLRPRLPA